MGEVFVQSDIWDYLLDYLREGKLISSSTTGTGYVEYVFDTDKVNGVNFTTAAAHNIIATIGPWPGSGNVASFQHVAIRTLLNTGTLSVRVRGWISTSYPSGSPIVDYTFTVTPGERMYYGNGLQNTTYRYGSLTVTWKVEFTLGGGQTLMFHSLEAGNYLFDSGGRLNLGDALNTVQLSTSLVEESGTSLYPLRMKTSANGVSGGKSVLAIYTDRLPYLSHRGLSTFFVTASTGAGGKKINFFNARNFFFHEDCELASYPPNLSGKAMTISGIALSPADGPTFAFDATQYKKGSGSWKMTKGVAAGTNASVYLGAKSESVGTDPGIYMYGFDENKVADGVFSFSAWVKSTCTIGTFMIVIKAWVDTGWTALNTFATTASGSWEQLSGTFTIPFVGHTVSAVTVELLMASTEAGTVTANIDDLFIGRIS